MEEGLERRDAQSAAAHIGRSRTALLKTMVEKELGLSYGEDPTELGDAAGVGGSYALAALIPLWPYFFLEPFGRTGRLARREPLALFGLGVVKGPVARLQLVRSGLEVLFIGGLSAGLGYLIGGLGPHLLGH